MAEELMTAEEVAAFLRVDERTVTAYRTLDEDPLPFVKLGGAIRFRRAAVERWVKGRERG